MTDAATASAGPIDRPGGEAPRRRTGVQNGGVATPQDAAAADQ